MDSALNTSKPIGSTKKPKAAKSTRHDAEEPPAKRVKSGGDEAEKREKNKLAQRARRDRINNDPTYVKRKYSKAPKMDLTADYSNEKEYFAGLISFNDSQPEPSNADYISWAKILPVSGMSSTTQPTQPTATLDTWGSNPQVTFPYSTYPPPAQGYALDPALFDNASSHASINLQPEEYEKGPNPTKKGKKKLQTPLTIPNFSPAPQTPPTIPDDIASPADSFVSPLKLENSWIMELCALWDSPPISNITPVKSVGSDILNALLRYPHILTKYPSNDSTLILLQKPSQFGSSPTLGHVIRDLVQPDNHNVFDFVNQYGDPDVEYPEFILSMLRSGEGKAWEDSRRLYGALNIRESDVGIGSCQLKAVPFNNEQKSLVDEDGWASTWTPPGAISHTHMDFYGSMQYFIHFYGKKLWLLWPPTPRNLEWFSSQHKQRANGNRVLDCIRHLDGLQLHYVDNSEVFFVLKPNTLHACISFSSSGHTGVQVWSLTHFDESYAIMDWGIQWLKTGFYGTLGQSRAELLEEVDTLMGEVEKWGILAKRNPKHPSTVGVKEKVKSISQRLSELERLLKVSPPQPSYRAKNNRRNPQPKEARS